MQRIYYFVDKFDKHLHGIALEHVGMHHSLWHVTALQSTYLPVCILFCPGPGGDSRGSRGRWPRGLIKNQIYIYIYIYIYILYIYHIFSQMYQEVALGILPPT